MPELVVNIWLGFDKLRNIFEPRSNMSKNIHKFIAQSFFLPEHNVHLFDNERNGNSGKEEIHADQGLNFKINAYVLNVVVTNNIAECYSRQ